MWHRRLRPRISLRLLLLLFAASGAGSWWFGDELLATLATWTGPRGGVVNFDSRPGEGAVQAWPSFAEMHASFEDEFVNSPGFGYQRTVRMNVPWDKMLVVNGAPYKLATLELVSLDVQGKPAAYVNPSPVVTRLTYSQAPTRPLTRFEADSLAYLRAGGKTVFNGQENSPVVVAPLRASASCLQCHSVQPGDLLGAFSYQLAPYDALRGVGAVLFPAPTKPY